MSDMPPSSRWTDGVAVKFELSVDPVNSGPSLLQLQFVKELLRSQLVSLIRSLHRHKKLASRRVRSHEELDLDAMVYKECRDHDLEEAPYGTAHIQLDR